MTNETNVAADLELETDMPKSRALRRRARFYLEQAHSLLHGAVVPLEGKSGLTADDHLKLLQAGFDGIALVRTAVTNASNDIAAAIVEREAEKLESDTAPKIEKDEEEAPF